MKRLSYAICLFAFTLGAVDGAEPTQNPSQAVPTQFLGDWNSKMEDCDTGLNDSALSIDPRWIRFYESGGPIIAVVTKGKTTLTLIARLTSAEDETTVWDSPMQFELSPNGAVLKDTTGPDSSMTRYKCPHHTPPKGIK
jgi:hypothetical protein